MLSTPVATTGNMDGWRAYTARPSAGKARLLRVTPILSLHSHGLETPVSMNLPPVLPTRDHKGMPVLSVEALTAASRTVSVGTSSVGTSSVGTSSVGTSSVGTSSVGTSSVGTSSVGTSSFGTSRCTHEATGAVKNAIAASAAIVTASIATNVNLRGAVTPAAIGATILSAATPTPSSATTLTSTSQNIPCHPIGGNTVQVDASRSLLETTVSDKRPRGRPAGSLDRVPRKRKRESPSIDAVINNTAAGVKSQEPTVKSQEPAVKEATMKSKETTVVTRRGRPSGVQDRRPRRPKEYKKCPDWDEAAYKANPQLYREKWRKTGSSTSKVVALVSTIPTAIASLPNQKTDATFFPCAVPCGGTVESRVVLSHIAGCQICQAIAAEPCSGEPQTKMDLISLFDALHRQYTKIQGIDSTHPLLAQLRSQMQNLQIRVNSMLSVPPPV